MDDRFEYAGMAGSAATLAGAVKRKRRFDRRKARFLSLRTQAA